jgi:hypothetical protein
MCVCGNLPLFPRRGAEEEEEEEYFFNGKEGFIVLKGPAQRPSDKQDNVAEQF